MEAFGYVSVILSVVIGLGLSHLLTGVVDLAKARRRVRFYWVHPVWVALTFVGHVFLWWTMWNLRLMKSWDFHLVVRLYVGRRYTLSRRIMVIMGFGAGGGIPTY